MKPPAPRPGWYDDPHDPLTFLRWWDGAGWTDHLYQRNRVLEQAGQGATPPPPTGFASPVSPSTSSRVKVAAAIGLVGLLILFGVWNPDADDDIDTSRAAVAVDRPPAEPPKRQAGPSAQEQRRAERAQRAAQRQVAAVREAEQLCEQAGGEPERALQDEPTVVVRCVENDFVALVGWDADSRNHRWTRWWVLGRKPATVSAGSFRHARPLSKPLPPAPPPVPAAPAPVAPAAPAAPAAPSVPDGYFVGNNGYTGPRCYAPGGVYWKPC